MDTPSEQRRLVLLLYAIVGPVFCGSLVVLGRWREDPRPLLAVLALITTAALWLVLRPSPKLLDWIFPVAVAPVVCCGIGFLACGDRGAAYLAVMGAPLAWAAVLFALPVVLAALATSVVTVFVALSVRIGVTAAAVSTLLLSPLAGLVAWVVFVTAHRLREARHKLIDHGERARALLQAIPDTLARADREGRFLDVYSPPGDALPVPKEQLLGRNVSEFVPPAVAARMREAIDGALQTGEVRTVEYTVAYGDKRRTFESRFARCGTDKVIAIRRDVSRYRMIEQVLKESEERYRSIVAATAEGFVMRRADGAISAANPAAVRMLGIDGSRTERLTPADPGWYTIREDGTVLAAEDQPDRMVLRTGKPMSDFTMGLHKPDGSITWLSVNSQPLFREGEQVPWAVVMACRDVTEQRRQALELARNRRQLALAVEGSDLGYWDWDLRTDRTTYSPLWPALLGYAPDEIEPRYRAWAKLVHPEDFWRVKRGGRCSPERIVEGARHRVPDAISGRQLALDPFARQGRREGRRRPGDPGERDPRRHDAAARR